EHYTCRSGHGSRLALVPLAGRDDSSEVCCMYPSHHCPSGCAKSSRKYLNTHCSGLGAAWPRPQIEASRIACDSSPSSASSQGPFSISLTAFSVPTRHGVHCPQLSSSKKRMRLSAPALASALSESTTTAWEPTKQPCGSSVPKSSGRFAIEAGRMPPEAPPGR